MPKPERRDPAKEKRWRQLLRQWQRSGLTGRDFCAEQGLSEPSFYAWRQEIARRDQENRATPRREESTRLTPARLPTFVPVTVDGDTAAPTALEVVLSNGRRVQVAPDFDAALLRRLLRVLEEPSC